MRARRPGWRGRDSVPLGRPTSAQPDGILTWFLAHMQPLTSVIELERAVVEWNASLLLWATVTLTAAPFPDGDARASAAHLVFLVNVSRSMSAENKLSSVKHALRAIVAGLGPGHHVTLLTYTNEVVVLAEHMSCTAANRAWLADCIDALATVHIPRDAAHALVPFMERADEVPALERAAALLVTHAVPGRPEAFFNLGDGLAPPRRNHPISDLAATAMPRGAVGHVFALGALTATDRLVQQAELFRGRFYACPDGDAALTDALTDCLAATLAQRVSSVIVSVECASGTRIVGLDSPYAFAELQPNKQYAVLVPTLTAGAHCTLVLQLSLRAMEEEVPLATLALVGITGVADDGRSLALPLARITAHRTQVAHTEMVDHQQVSAVIDEQLNRMAVASTLRHVIAHPDETPEDALNSVCSMISRSPSGTSLYAQKLILFMQGRVHAMMSAHVGVSHLAEYWSQLFADWTRADAADGPL